MSILQHTRHRTCRPQPVLAYRGVRVDHTNTPSRLSVQVRHQTSRQIRVRLCWRSNKLSCKRERGNEWRFSFSMAELIIIRGWTSSQRIAYRVLRLNYKKIQQDEAKANRETALCSYYFKTLMMWACEERREEFWVEHPLVHTIQQLLIEMAEWLTSTFCCNYFIRDNNMMDYLAHTDVSSEVSALHTACASRDLVSLVAGLCACD